MRIPTVRPAKRIQVLESSELIVVLQASDGMWWHKSQREIEKYEIRKDVNVGVCLLGCGNQSYFALTSPVRIKKEYISSYI